MTSAPSHDCIRIASRGSALALAQTETVIRHLSVLHPGLQCRVQRIQTEGDQRQTESLQRMSGRGVFVKAIEEALLRGEADLAIHSLKDMPTTLPEGLLIAAILEREDPRDALISHTGMNLAELPNGASVGTGAPRRVAQIHVLRPDLRVVDLRGNVDTRLRKMRNGDCDAIVLAAAGLKRLGLLDESVHIISLEQMMPAAGQGALALECRLEDEWLKQLVSPLDHAATRSPVTAERSFLCSLGGGCQLPIAAHADLIGVRRLRLRGRVARPDESLWQGEIMGSVGEAVALGESLAAQALADVRDLSMLE